MKKNSKKKESRKQISDIENWKDIKYIPEDDVVELFELTILRQVKVLTDFFKYFAISIL